MSVSQPEQQLHDFDDLADDVDFLFQNYFKSPRPVMMPVRKGWKPATDVYETGTDLVIVIDIAGIATSDVKITLERNVLVIRGIRREYCGEQRRHFHKMEINVGLFERRIELPIPVDTERSTTRYQQGLLEIRSPKRETGPRRVQIEEVE